MQKKSYREYRLEAEALNQAATEQGNPPPIPDHASLRKEPLAKQVIQVRLDQHKQEVNNGAS